MAQINYDDRGMITINFEDLVENMDLEAKQRLAERLACTEEIIEHVAEQITTGWTKNMSSGSTAMACEKPWTAIDTARRLIAERSGEVAAAEIDRLCNALTWQKEQTEASAESARKLRNWCAERNLYPHF